MTREQAEKLYNLSQVHYVLYTESPYVAEVESGRIELETNGNFVYKDSALCDINVEECDVSDFAVYEKFEAWEYLD